MSVEITRIDPTPFRASHGVPQLVTVDLQSTSAHASAYLQLTCALPHLVTVGGGPILPIPIVPGPQTISRVFTFQMNARSTMVVVPLVVSVCEQPSNVPIPTTYEFLGTITR